MKVTIRPEHGVQLQNLDRGQVFLKNTKILMLLAQPGIGSPKAIDLQTGELNTFSPTTLVEVVEAELVIGRRS